jgi:hypothetical protein
VFSFSLQRPSLREAKQQEGESKESYAASNLRMLWYQD